MAYTLQKMFIENTLQREIIITEIIMVQQILILVFVIYFQDVVAAKDVFISQTQESQDMSTCGKESQPCRTLEYTILNIVCHGDTVLLDGGTQNAFHYTITRTISIKKSITIKSQSKRIPTITTTCNVSPMFAMYSNILNLEKVKLSQFQHGFKVYKNTTQFTITNCTFHTFFSLLDNQNYFNWFLLQIKDTHFENYHHAILVYSTVALNIQSSHFYGSNTCYKACSQSFAQVAISLLEDDKKHAFNIQISQTTFENCSTALSMERCVTGHISIGNSTFKHNHLRIWHSHLTPFENYTSNLYLAGRVTVSISHSTFIGNMAMKGGAIKVTSKAKISLINNKFENNIAVHEGGAVHLNAYHANMESNIFRNNFVNPSIYRTIIPAAKSKFYASSKDGGAVWNSGNLTILKCSFFDNTAPAFGGSVYHTSSRRGNYALSVKDSVINGSKTNLSYVGSLVYSNALLSLQNTRLNVLAAKNYGSVLYYYDVVNTEDQQGSHLLNFTLVCPPNYKLSTEKIDDRFGNFFSLIYFCSVCDKGTYSLEYEYEIFNSKDKNVSTRNTITCHPCPTGAICNYGIICNDNFYGYVDKKNQTQFIQCPPSYCCSRYGNNCTSYDTCAYNRHGMLCGRCINGYSENLLSPGCVENQKCGQIWFWILLLSFASCYLITIIYLKDITKFFKKILKSEKETVRSNRELLIPRTASMSSESLLEDELGTELDAPQQISYNEEKNTFTFSGILKIVLFFYQVELLLHVNAASKQHFKMFTFWKDLAISIFNVKPSFRHNMLVLCPLPNLDAVTKELVKLLFIGCIFGILLIVFIVCHVLSINWKKHDPSQEQNERKVEVIDVFVSLYEQIPFKLRLKCGFLQLLLFCYTPITTSMFQFMNCVHINDSKHLYMNAEVKCFTWWQYLNGFILCMWILPFCLVLYWNITLLKECKIRPNEFLKALMFPPLVLIYFIKSKIYREHGFLSMKEARDSRHLLQVFSEPFRHKYAKWEGMILLRRVILTILYVFIINPVVRLYMMFFFLTVFLLDHLRIQPYKGKFLNWLETISLILLNCFAAVNLFWAESYMYDVVPQSFMLGEVFLMVEVTVLVLPGILLTIAILFKCIKKVLLHCKKCC